MGTVKFQVCMRPYGTAVGPDPRTLAYGEVKWGIPHLENTTTTIDLCLFGITDSKSVYFTQKFVILVNVKIQPGPPKRPPA